MALTTDRESRFGIVPSEWDAPGKSTKDADKDTANYLDHYLTELWRADLSAEAISIPNETIGTDLKC
jgi:hypothetical protein